MSPVNEKIAYFDPGDDLTGQATADITGGRFLKVSGPKQVGSQALASDTLGGSILVAHADADDPVIGVSTYDVASGSKIPVVRGHKVFPVEAGAAMTAGERVQSDATGRAITLAAGFACGIVLNSPTAAGQTAIVALNL